MGRSKISGVDLASTCRDRSGRMGVGWTRVDIRLGIDIWFGIGIRIGIGIRFAVDFIKFGLVPNRLHPTGIESARRGTHLVRMTSSDRDAFSWLRLIQLAEIVQEDSVLVSVGMVRDSSLTCKIRLLFFSSTSLNSNPKTIHLLTEQENSTQEVNPKFNLFDEEVRFEEINQNMDDWTIPEIPQDELYVPENQKQKRSSDYIIKTVENNIPLGQGIGEEFHLLSKDSIIEHTKKYKYLHIGCVQIAIKPLIDMGLDVAVLMCLRDIRHNKFEDSLIGIVETSLGQGPVYFNCYPNKTVSLMDRNILDSLFLNIKFHGLDMKESSIPAALIYRIQYKVMNTCASRVLLKPQKGETTLFITDMTKANVSLPRTIKWDEVTLPEKWIMEKATPSLPRLAPCIEDIRQNNSRKVEITFNRRNSFSSRIEASHYGSARRSFSVPTSIPIGLFRSASQN
ncbi:hypothetical protein CR513_22806, partial [Mucuna pruriens]